MTKGSSSSHAPAVISGCVALFLFLYVFVPVPIALVMYYATERGILPISMASGFFTPLVLLAQKVPAYSRLIDQEMRLCQQLEIAPK